MPAPIVYGIFVGGMWVYRGYRVYRTGSKVVRGANALRKGAGGLQKVRKVQKKASQTKKGKKCTGNCKKKKKKKNREKYMGRTPGKNSKTGREVIDRMRKNGDIRGSGKNMQFKDSKGVWRPLKDADMSHKTDAVKWWNSTGRKFGAKSPEVRKWMLDSKNYRLDYYKINRSAGGKLADRYLPPLK